MFMFSLPTGEFVDGKSFSIQINGEWNTVVVNADKVIIDPEGVNEVRSILRVTQSSDLVSFFCSDGDDDFENVDVSDVKECEESLMSRFQAGHHPSYWIGKDVKIGFRFSGDQKEDMWICVAEYRHDTNQLIGTLHNDPAHAQYVRAGDTIHFRPGEILQVREPTIPLGQSKDNACD